MKKRNQKKVLSVLLAAAMLLQGFSVVFAAGAKTPQLYHYVFDEQDAAGNYVQPYYTDAHGNRIASPQPSGVSAAEDTLPSAYDARTNNWITPVKYQSGSSSCWAFSTLACMETSMVKQGLLSLDDADYSEAHLAWFGQRQRVQDTSDPTYGDGRNIDNPFTYGGNWQHASATLMRGSGVQLESNALWIESRDASVMMQMEQPESDRYVSFARLRQTRTTSDIATAKQMILDYGAVYTNYYDDTGYANLGYNKTNACYYQNAMTSTNHAVTIVGWDNAYPASNFNEGLQPAHDGAWLIKGSWSNRYGNSGYYWLSYEDPSCKEFTSFSAMPADTFDHIYQYDGAFCTTGWDYDSATASIANLFYADETQLLTHVALYNPNYGTTVKAQVYTGGTGYTLSGTDPTADMTLRAVKTVTGVDYGYSTFELNQPILLEKGEAFTVVMNLTNPNASSIRIPIEGVSPSPVTASTVTRGGDLGESFVKFTTAWYDTNNYSGNDYNNVPIKAMTRDLETVEPTLTVASAPDKTEYFVGESLDTTGLTLSYSNEYGTVSTVTDGFLCTPTVFDTVGTQTVTVTYADLSASFDVTVLPLPVQPGALSVSDGEGHPGDTVQLTVSMDENPGIAMTRLHIGYDASALELLNAQNGSVFENTFFTPGNDKTLVPYTILWMDALGTENHTGTGTLATLSFRIRDTAAAGTTSVTLTVDETSTCDVDFTAVPFTVQSGTITVQALQEPSLSLVTMPNKTDYIVGESLDTTGLTLSYTDAYGAVSTVTDSFVCTPTVFDTAGSQIVTVTYADLSVTFDVTVQSLPAGELALSVSDGSGYPGDTVQITVSANVNPGIATARLHFAYDADALELLNVQNGTVFEDTYFTPGNDKALVPYTVLWMDALGTENHTGTGTLVTLTFRILDTAAEGSTPITLTVDENSTFDVDLENVPFSVRNGTVTICALAAPMLTLLTAPDKTDYLVGETLDTTGLTLAYTDAYGVATSVTDGFVCTPTVWNTEGTQTVTVTYAGLSVTFDVTVQNPVQEPPRLAAADGAQTVIDTENNLIYGLTLELSEEELLQEYLTVEGSGSIRAVYSAYIGTGTEVQLLDSDGRLVSRYSLVLFGDVDGDGTVTTDDIRAIKGHVTGAAEFAPGSAQELAADVDGDGVITMQDATMLKGMISGAVTLNQATRRTED